MDYALLEFGRQLKSEFRQASRYLMFFKVGNHLVGLVFSLEIPFTQLQPWLLHRDSPSLNFRTTIFVKSPTILNDAKMFDSPIGFPAASLPCRSTGTSLLPEEPSIAIDAPDSASSDSATREALSPTRNKCTIRTRN
jgi:hypothetical protein